MGRPTVTECPRLRWFDALLCSVLVAGLAFAAHNLDAPPCEKGSGGECGCEPVNGPCSMPCSGCCPGGCKAVGPLPSAR